MRQKYDETGFERAFIKAFGPKAIDDLVAAFTDKPIVLIGGDQATGKGTLAEVLAARMGGETVSMGKKFVRSMAAERGISVEEMSRELKNMPNVDVQIDYYACKAIAAGEVATLDSRLAGALGQLLRRLGRQNIATVYLSCAPREQALRFVNRELSPAARVALEQILPASPDTSMAECMKCLARLDDPKAAQVAARFEEIAGRDVVDYQRLLGLYDVDYRDRKNFDFVIDTTRNTPEQVVAAVLDRVPAEFVPAHVSS